jgi:hypothetical protein
MIRNLSPTHCGADTLNLHELRKVPVPSGHEFPREVINRDEYLKKRLRQLEAIREFLAAHPLFLQERNLIDRPTEPKDFEFLLLCKGHLGSETIRGEGI